MGVVVVVVVVVAVVVVAVVDVNSILVCMFTFFLQTKR